MSLSNKYRIYSGIIPSVGVQVPSGLTVIAETGAYLAGSPSFEQTTERFQSKSGSGLRAFFSGESIFVNQFTNRGSRPEEILFSSNQSSVVVDISEELKEGILCARGAFFAATMPIHIGLRKVRDFPLGNLTRQSLWMQFCKKSDPKDDVTMFLSAASTPVKIVLGDGEFQIVDNNSLLAMTDGVKLSLYENAGLKRALAGGEGKFMTVVEGPGTIWVATALKPPSLISKLSRKLFNGLDS